MAHHCHATNCKAVVPPTMVIAVAEKEGIEPDTSLYDIFETIANAREEQPQ